MKPIALARGARRQPASARAPHRTAPHARLTLASPDASAPTTPLRTASTASLLHCISSSLPSLLLPSSCTAAGTRPDRAAPRAPHHPHDARRTTHCHATSPQSPRARPSWLPLALEERGKGREANKSQLTRVHARTAPPRRAPLPAPPVHADAPCSPFHPPALPQPPPPVSTVDPSFMGLRSLLACAPDVSRSADQRVWLAVEGGHRGGRSAG